EQEGQHVRFPTHGVLQKRGPRAVALALPRACRLRAGELPRLCYGRRRARQCRKQHCRSRRHDFRPAMALGFEVKLNQDWSAKIEYLYVGLQDKSYFNPAPSPFLPDNRRLQLDDHIVRVGVNYKLPWNVLDSFFKR